MAQSYAASRGGRKRPGPPGGGSGRGGGGSGTGARGRSGGYAADGDDDYSDEFRPPSLKSETTGRLLRTTPQPSIQNVFAGFYNSLPAPIRDMLPFGSETADGDNHDDDSPPKDARPESGWKDVCYLFAIPGDDEDEGLVVLADGSMRKYISCKGINALLFDEADRESMARQFTNFVNSCESDIQVIIK